MQKILIADDEAHIRRLVCDFLRREGYEPLEAEDGEQALAVFHANPDTALVLLDVMMPQLDGWEVCRKLRSGSGRLCDKALQPLRADETRRRPATPRTNAP